MLYTIAVVLIFLWLLGLVTSYTMGGVIHVLLLIALVMMRREPHFRTQARVKRNETRGSPGNKSRTY